MNAPSRPRRPIYLTPGFFGPWLAYLAFAAGAFALTADERLFSFSGRGAPGKAAVWVVWIGFLLYSVVASTKANLFDTIREMSGDWWGRQIGTDLYIGITMFAALIYFNEGSPLTLLIWLAPLIIYANLTTLLYLAIHYDQIVDKLSGG
ncbi:MAG: hypothetical protein KC620_22640 [Myxococcales bacterium]|nr:hypothetical protein [Myxococcales bacterium]